MSMQDGSTPPFGIGGGLAWKAAVQAVINIPQALQQIYQMLVMRLPAGGSTLASGSANTTGTGSVSVVGAVAGKAVWVNSYSIVNSGASGTTVSFQDGSGGTTIWEEFVPAGSAVRINTLSPIFKTSSGNGLYFQAGTGTTTLYVSAAGFAA